MKSTLQPLVFCFLACTLSVDVAGQKIVTETLLENVHNWREGFITLSDGQELSGLLRFDDNSGVLSFQNGAVTKALIAKSCSKFEFFDEAQSKQRVFYSLEYDDGQTFKKFYFFELLRSLNDFVVLSKVDPIAVQTKSHGTLSNYYYPGTTYTTTEVRQTETIYFMDRDGAIKPYVRILEKDSDMLFDHKRSRNKFIDRKLLESFTGSYYKKLESFAGQKGLNLKLKGDLIQVLDFYAELVGQP